jgi:MFS transporter, UMF1 family
LALFSADALNPGVRKREVFGWAMYDFANSGYTTVVLTAVFAAYFVGGIAGKAEWATFAWTAALSISYAIVMLTMPSIGAYADLRAAKKRLLVLFTAACVVSTAALALTGPGTVALAVVLIILSNTFYSYGESLTAAFLPELARPHALGKVSGWGWSFGYFGGMLALGLGLGYVIWAQGQGIKAEQFVPVTMLITAVLYGCSARGPSPTRRRCGKAGSGQRCSNCIAPSARPGASRTSCGCWRARRPTRAASRWRSRWPRSTPRR